MLIEVEIEDEKEDKKGVEEEGERGEAVEGQAEQEERAIKEVVKEGERGVKEDGWEGDKM